MDRELSASFKNSRLIKITAIICLLIGCIVSGFLIIRGYLKLSISQNEITVATVDEGMIEVSVNASGIVVPEYEFVITSPVHAKIERVFYHAGEAVKEGESILQLNKDATLDDYTKLLDEQAVNHNREDQLGLELERSLSELKTQYTIKEMNILGLETALDHERALLKIGGSTDEKVKQAGLNLSISKLELLQLKAQMKNQQKMMQSDLKGLGYQMSIQNKNIKAYRNKLSQAEIQSPAKGVVTWVASKIGSAVNEGDELARISDLGSYKIEGKIADSYASQLKRGGRAIIKIDDHELRGTVINIQPEVQEGMVKFYVSPNEPSNPVFRSNLKVDLYLVTAVKPNVLRITNGAVFTGAEQQKIFVIKGNEAFSRMINVGQSNYQYVEIISGLKRGDKVIISDIRELDNVDKVVIKN
jgi:HlyD family secretion protein